MHFLGGDVEINRVKLVEVDDARPCLCVPVDARRKERVAKHNLVGAQVVVMSDS